MTVKYLVKVDDAGHTLRADFAAAYFRALAAGMPKGGVDVFSRTLAQQAALVKVAKRRGVVTAPATESAPHVSGRAMDLHTTNSKTGKYDPSPAHVWLAAGGRGDLRPQKGEKLRSHRYGMYRTVPSERWHFGYLPEKDVTANSDLDARLKSLGYTELTRSSRVKAFQSTNGLSVDGKAGPQTWFALLNKPKPKPKQETPVAVSANIRVGQLNMELWGGSQSAASFKARGAFLRNKMRCSVYLLQETSPALPGFRSDMRSALLSELGPQWKCAAESELAVLYDGDKWEPGTPRSVKFGVYQGALCLPLTHKESGMGIDFTTTHVRPGKVTNPIGKLYDIRRAFALSGKWAAVEGGDHNTNAWRKVLPKGWVAATPNVKTQGSGSLDHIGVRSGTTGTIDVKGFAQLDPGPLSDHTAWAVTLTITNTTKP